MVLYNLKATSYELQVSSGVQGQGIGSLMMSKLVKLSRSTGMEGIMLTVLKGVCIENRL